MKKYNIRSIILLGISALLFVTSCSSPRKNELIYKFSADEGAIPVDSLRSEILNAQGTEMIVMYPDSDVVIIHYDRFRTHQDIIETQFRHNGYHIVLLKKKAIREGEQPWEKK
jgi:hypothetical protein